MVYGVQLFGCSENFRHDTNKFFSDMKRIGLMQIEPCILFDEPNKFKEDALKRGDTFFAKLPNLLWLPHELPVFEKTISEMQMQIHSAHAFVSDIEKSSELIINTLKGSLIKALVLNVPAVAYDDKELCLAQLSKLAKALKTIGVELWLHNLGDDIKHKVDEKNSLYMWLIKNSEDLFAQPDTGWVLFGGEDPYEFLVSLGDKLRSIHFKDLNENYKNLSGNDIFEPLGKGIIDTQKIMSLSEKVSSVVIDQDFSRDDFVSDLEFSAKLLHSIR